MYQAIHLFFYFQNEQRRHPPHFQRMLNGDLLKQLLHLIDPLQPSTVAFVSVHGESNIVAICNQR